MERCCQCFKLTRLQCCDGQYYCGVTCQAKDWDAHRSLCLGRSSVMFKEQRDETTRCKVIFDELIVAEFIQFELSMDQKLFPSKELEKAARIYRQTKGEIPSLTIRFGFKKDFAFLEYFDFKLKVIDFYQVKYYDVDGKRVAVLQKDINVIYSWLQDNTEMIDFKDAFYSILHNRLIKNDDAIIEKEKDYLIKNVWHFRDSTTLAILLLLEGNLENFKKFQDHKKANYQLELVSRQGYVKHQISKLFVERQAAKQGNPHRGITLAVADFDNFLWKSMIKNYKKTNLNTYYVRQLKDRKKISFFARKNEYEIAGYVTCDLSRQRDFEKDDSYTMDKNLKLFQSLEDDNYRTRLYNCFSIDGLHVTGSERGGGNDSIATMLIYMALFFAKQCVDSGDFEHLIITSNAYARSTMLILAQFGFTNNDPRQLLNWMQSDEKKTNLMNDVIYYINLYKEFDPALGLLQIPDVTNRTNDQAIKLITQLESSYRANKDIYPLNSDKLDYFDNNDKSGWNSFLTLSSTQPNEVFEKEMARITAKVRNERLPSDKRKVDDDDVKVDKRTKIEAHFSHAFLEKSLIFL
jgi:hypothetical protein